MFGRRDELAIGQRLDESAVLGQVLRLQHPGTTAINDRQAVVAEENDVVRVQVGVEEVVLEYLPPHGMKQAGPRARLDVVLLQPGRKARRVLAAHFDVVGHQRPMDEFHGQQRRVL